MMNAHVMMLVLASGLFSAMWSSDHPATSVPPVIATRTELPRQQPAPAVSTHLKEAPGRAGPAADLSIVISMVQPVRDFQPGDRVVVKTDRSSDASMDWTTSEFQEMAGSGQSLKIMRDEITQTSVSAELDIGDNLWRAARRWFTTTHGLLGQAWTRWRRARDVSQRAQRTARQ